MRVRRLTVALLLTAGSVVVPLVAAGGPAVATPVAGGVFVTGHDPDFHAFVGGNQTGARHIVQRAIAFVTHDNPAPTVLFATSRIAPPGGHIDGVNGITAAGYAADVASAGGIAGTLDLATVNFAAYDVVVVASDYGGILTQAELDILNARAEELRNYVNDGGGLVAFAESNSGAGLTPGGGHFEYLPFIASEVALNQNESGYTVTAFGASLGLVDSDVNGNASHNVFTDAGGMSVVNVDAAGRIMSLAHRGPICRDGVPSASVADATPVVEGNPPAGGVATFTVTLDPAPCESPVSLSYATSAGTATAGTDYTPVSGTLTFGIGETTKTVTVPVTPDLDFEADETFLVELADVVAGSITDAQALGVIVNDDAANGAPDCSAVAASLAELWPPNHQMHEVSLSGATDADGDAVTLSITGVTQDEPTEGAGDGDTGPDAARLSPATDRVLLRAERSGTGDGRVYALAFTGDDGRGGTCQGTVYVGVRHARPTAPVDSGQTYDSFG